MARRDRIIMIKRATPKRVTLPNGRTFLARYRRATRDDLPPNVTFPRVYKERARTEKRNVKTTKTVFR